MPRNIALVIGINEYEELSSLNYAERDAELVAEFLHDMAGFNADNGGEVCLCTHTSPKYDGFATQPTRKSLRKILRKRFERERFLGIEDSFWFFFSGHGIRHCNKDYLMPIDGDPEELAESAIELNYVIERLTRSGAGQIVVILDACRVEGRKISQLDFGQDVPEGVTTIFSCAASEASYEVGEPIYQSTFTYTLLQSFRKQQKNGLTLLQLEQYLQTYVPQLNQQHNKPTQKPSIKCDFVSNGGKILLPHLRFPLTVSYPKESFVDRHDVSISPSIARDVPVPSNDYIGDINKLLENEKRILEEIYVFWKRHEKVEICNGSLAEALRLNIKEVTDYLEDFVAQGLMKLEDSTLDEYCVRLIPHGMRLLNELCQDDLSSAKGIDYRQLRDLLQTAQWQKADRETAHRMLEVVRRREDDWIRVDEDEMSNFPCTDLMTIDRLWMKYSSGQFGLSVQADIWQQLGSPLDFSKGWDRFCVRVGWQDAEAIQYLSYEDLHNNLTFPAIGSLPYSWWVTGWNKFPVKQPISRSKDGKSSVRVVCRGIGFILLSRIGTCKPL
ncbi:GUN4 domain-containing protein [Leptolyngbya iicbica]|uniref:Uncharacterized protein n=2 Tax=Cyanophyceae TaxID=3028117 RepID=A0A4Q7E3X9_9CYAN|nr:GUN4 domain-containing protein [Leptolyngbya sp. LK]RZM76064.1 hypothetical protein DYY88_19415 [Leptolyngbya sp. LK]